MQPCTEQCSPRDPTLTTCWTLLPTPCTAAFPNAFHCMRVARAAETELRAALRRAVLDEEDEEPYFDPLEGNVAFASAFDGWAFQLHHFAELSAPKLGCSVEELRRWDLFL